MPTYEYRCPKCGDFETVQKITEDALKTCPNCGSDIQRLVSAPAFHLKGSGWYKTDYASGSSRPAASSATSSDSSNDSGSEKPAAAAESSKGEASISKSEATPAPSTSTSAESKPSS